MTLDAGRSSLRDNPRRHFAFGSTGHLTEPAASLVESRARRRLAEVNREHSVGILNFLGWSTNVCWQLLNVLIQARFTEDGIVNVLDSRNVNPTRSHIVFQIKQYFSYSGRASFAIVRF